MSNLPWGLHYFHDTRPLAFSLLHVRAAASITDLAAQVKLTQTYENDTVMPIEAIYVFPVPARGAVCSFVLVKQDGQKIYGRVQEKTEARETYVAAVSQGKQAGLLAQQTPDVFQLAVGSIMPQEQVVVELVYTTEISEDEDNDSVRFHLPMYIGARYGQIPLGIQGDLSAAVHCKPPFLEISVCVEAVAPIVQIGCPSHSVTTQLGPDPALPGAADLPFSNYARVFLSSESALDKDFILTFKAAGLDAPRCTAELHPTHSTVALALTLVPRFKLPDVPQQEFIFLVDRSGSMQGQRIGAAKKALVVMLRSLPAKDSMFQIASFGTACTMLWDDGSRPYNQLTLEDATRHVDSMHADCGGTRIAAALALCFSTRRTDRPTSVFVLTDGAVWNVDGVVRGVSSAVASALPQAYLRVSVLGIGNSASTAMCEGIARAGNGTCSMVGEQETSFTGKIARMLRAARTPLVTGVTVDWGVQLPINEPPKPFDVAKDVDEFVMVPSVQETRSTVAMFDETVDPLQFELEPVPPPPEVVLLPFSPVQQSPFKIRTISPGTRLNAYAILQGQSIPKTVTLAGSTGDGSEITLSVPVTIGNLANSPESPPAIHALTARKLIQDLEDGQHAIAVHPDDPDLLARTVNASIVRLGKLYSIASSQTSFVAVDESDNRTPQVSRMLSGANFGYPEGMTPAELWKSSSHRFHALPQNLAGRERMPDASSSHPVQNDHKRSIRLTLDSSSQEQYVSSPLALRNDLHRRAKKLRRTAAPSSLDPGSGMAFAANATAADSPGSVDATGWALPESWSVPSLMHTDDACSKDTEYLRRMCFKCKKTEAASWRRSIATPGEIVCNKCGLLERTHLRPRPLLQSDSTASASGPFGSAPSTDPLDALARLQSFDGGFSLSVLSMVQLAVDVAQARAALLDGASDEVFATVLAMAFMVAKLGPDVERDAWEAMHEKASAFVQSSLPPNGGRSVDELQTMAVSMLA